MERSKMRKVEAREAYRAEKDVVMSEKMAAFKAKEDSTMAMLRDLAKKHQQ